MIDEVVEPGWLKFAFGCWLDRRGSEFYRLSREPNSARYYARKAALYAREAVWWRVLARHARDAVVSEAMRRAAGDARRCADDYRELEFQARMREVEAADRRAVR